MKSRRWLRRSSAPGTSVVPDQLAKCKGVVTRYYASAIRLKGRWDGPTFICDERTTEDLSSGTHESIADLVGSKVLPMCSGSRVLHAIMEQRQALGAAPLVPFGTTMNTISRAGKPSTEPNVECRAPVSSKKVSPTPKIRAGSWFTPKRTLPSST